MVRFKHEGLINGERSPRSDRSRWSDGTSADGRQALPVHSASALERLHRLVELHLHGLEKFQESLSYDIKLD